MSSLKLLWWSPLYPRLDKRFRILDLIPMETPSTRAREPCSLDHENTASDLCNATSSSSCRKFNLSCLKLLMRFLISDLFPMESPTQIWDPSLGVFLGSWKHTASGLCNATSSLNCRIRPEHFCCNSVHSVIVYSTSRHDETVIRIIDPTQVTGWISLRNTQSYPISQERIKHGTLHVPWWAGKVTYLMSKDTANTTSLRALAVSQTLNLRDRVT